jgi:hypothetical protein
MRASLARETRFWATGLAVAEGRRYAWYMGGETGRILLRFGERQWMDALVEKGEILMRQLVYYRGLENKAQGDPNEGLLIRCPAEDPTLKISANVGGKIIPLPETTLTINSPWRTHGVLCLYGMPFPEDLTEPPAVVCPRLAEDPNISQFNGDSLVLIVDAVEFDKRLKAAALSKGYFLAYGAVEYVPANRSGEMGPFRKVDSFAYQSEVRYVTRRPVPKDGLKLYLGSLQDITVHWDVSKELARGRARRAGILVR